jgi:hypothetical protein
MKKLGADSLQDLLRSPFLFENFIIIKIFKTIILIVM